ncbi:MAG: hypothetical protein ACYTFT_12355, partial [Planctomycetota bacterium]
MALAALGNSTAPLPITIEPAALTAWNDVLARGWPELRQQLIEPRLVAALQQQLQALTPTGTVKVTGIRNVALDANASPGLTTRPASTPGTQELSLELPLRPATWSLGFTVDVEATISTIVFGNWVTTVVALEARADVTGIQVTQPATLDVTNPAQPGVAAAGAQQVQLNLALSSANPILSQITPALTQILQPIIRAALVVAPIALAPQIQGILAQIPTTTWGTGIPAALPVTGVMDLEAAANVISEDVQRDHLPWNTLLPAIFDQPTYGSGKVVSYYDHGDSVGWTNHYVMGEAIRYDLTGDPRALAGAIRGMEGTLNCLDMAGPNEDGLLARCAVPVHDPMISLINTSNRYYEGVVNGLLYGGLGDMSRDHYLESLMGTTQAWLRVAELRPRAEEIVTRMVDYFEGNGWTIRKPGSNEFSTGLSWFQSPAGVLAFSRVAFTMQPGRYAAVHARYQALSSFLWLPAWSSAMEVNEQYFKFNLGHDELTTLYTTETDPVRYRDYVRMHQQYRPAIGHHDNAWFDTVFGLGVPAAAPLMAPRVRNALERWTLRPRRVFDPQLANDPTIVKVLYTSPLMANPAT